MKTSPFFTFSWRVIYLVLVTCVLLLISCSKNDSGPSCSTFSQADSVCYCTNNPTGFDCLSNAILTKISDNPAALTPFSGNNTLWAKGFVIEHTIYLIDRESSPNKVWKFNVDSDTDWSEVESFPGTDYGLVGSAEGKGYVSSYASAKIWEYNPSTDKWTAMDDLSFSSVETHWAEYKGLYYVPTNMGLQVFNPSTKIWTTKSFITETGEGSIMLINDNLYWHGVNDNEFSHYNFTSNEYTTHPFNADWIGSKNVANETCFVLGEKGYLTTSNDIRTFYPESNKWIVNETPLTSTVYPLDTFVIGDNAYLVVEGDLFKFTLTK